VVRDRHVLRMKRRSLWSNIALLPMGLDCRARVRYAVRTPESTAGHGMSSGEAAERGHTLRWRSWSSMRRSGRPSSAASRDPSLPQDA